MKGLGIDAVEIERIEDVLARREEGFLARVYTDAERALAGSGRGRAAFLAGRFAAKEAVLKALGTGWAQGLGFTHVEVLRDDSGAPRVVLHGAARRRADEIGIARVHVSITHSRTEAHAVAVAE